MQTEMVKIVVISEMPIEGSNSLYSRKIRNEYTLTSNHATSSYGQPVLVAPDNTVYGPNDILPNGMGADAAVEWAMRNMDDQGNGLANKFLALLQVPDSDPWDQFFTANF